MVSANQPKSIAILFAAARRSARHPASTSAAQPHDVFDTSILSLKGAKHASYSVTCRCPAIARENPNAGRATESKQYGQGSTVPFVTQALHNPSHSIAAIAMMQQHAASEGPSQLLCMQQHDSPIAAMSVELNSQLLPSPPA